MSTRTHVVAGLAVHRRRGARCQSKHLADRRLRRSRVRARRHNCWGFGAQLAAVAASSPSTTGGLAALRVSGPADLAARVQFAGIDPDLVYVVEVPGYTPTDRVYGERLGAGGFMPTDPAAIPPRPVRHRRRLWPRPLPRRRPQPPGQRVSPPLRSTQRSVVGGGSAGGSRVPHLAATDGEGVADERYGEDGQTTAVRRSRPAMATPAITGGPAASRPKNSRSQPGVAPG